ncbi:MAG: 4Fe-4S binding protein [Desulfomonile tiedjei]|uniref:4Fe-4S binding protein n=1 Tax=Desulfomonile tiedjei TaxID=2358 RepID=A0A9D6Z566_9BACT|nr:4Fe-4S binding protein [Desulfomonile tiedjei]
MIWVNPQLCTGCSMCVPACPEEAIACFGLAEIKDNCTDCLTCLDFCPLGALMERQSETDIDG